MSVSNEHKFLTPVFGTACPLRGVSGRIRRYAYTFSQARAAHWVLLLIADRVDVAENRVKALARGRPDRRITETGVLSELRHQGIQARVRQRRADVKHHPIDALMFVAPYVAMAGAVYALSRSVAGRTVVRTGALNLSGGR